MNRKWLKPTIKISAALLTLSGIVMLIWVFQLNSEMKTRLESGWFLPPVELYSAPKRFTVGDIFDVDEFRKYADSLQMRERSGSQKILDGDWSIITKSECERFFRKPSETEHQSCLIFDIPDTPKKRNPGAITLLSKESEVLGLYNLSDGLEVKELNLRPYKFAQYYNKKPILRRLVKVSETPLYCLQAITAIEDSKFLEHKGVSFTGTLRALYKNVVAGKYAEGGSTITQQLIKNYFLTSRKTIRRKIKEQFMALILEIQTDKDSILENYLNVIYMGANGPFQVRGFGAASTHYFQKPIESLDLAECALIAAIVNNPGKFNPFRKPENAKKRRARVLSKMLDQEMISQEEMDLANQEPLPTKRAPILSEPAPYFVSSVLRKIKELELDESNGLKIFTTLDLLAQETAQTVVAQKTEGIENWFANLKKLKEEKKKSLQSSLISIDIKRGHVVALVGGRSYRSTQYNRVLDAKRQVGSTMKPFVYLTALESLDEEGNSYSPLTPLEDSRFTHKYEGQSWSPKNYGDNYYGKVPMYFALKSSLNTSTAKLGLSVGLEAIVGLAKRFGIESDLKPLPSITLGAFEITPWELARAYTAIGRMGQYTDLQLVERIEDASGKLLYSPDVEESFASNAEATAVLISMMKQTLRTGTAKASAKMGIDFPAAGKTGTTSDSKDAWFVGFSPDILTVVWVGYDDNTPHGLTGASGALPIWAAYMKKVVGSKKAKDFEWPEGTFPTQVTPGQLDKVFDSVDEEELSTELLFRSQDNTFED